MPYTSKSDMASPGAGPDAETSITGVLWVGELEGVAARCALRSRLFVHRSSRVTCGVLQREVSNT